MLKREVIERIACAWVPNGAVMVEGTIGGVPFVTGRTAHSSDGGKVAMALCVEDDLTNLLADLPEEISVSDAQIFDRLQAATAQWWKGLASECESLGARESCWTNLGTCLGALAAMHQPQDSKSWGDTITRVQLGRTSIRCNDGTEISVKAGVAYYCTPRDDEGPYSAVEVKLLYPSSRSVPQFEAHREQEGDVYCCVPLALVKEFIEKHGGMTANSQQAR